MASSPFVIHDRKQSSAGLLRTLAASLPQGFKFGVYHLSTPPTKAAPLCHPPPDAHPDRTYCETHFLAITIDVKPQVASPNAVDTSVGDSTTPKALVLALEVYIFTTAFTSVFFVSKADSTGYLHLLKLPKGTPSPIREISSAFVAYLLQQRRRKDIRSVVNLFARAQSQYLFPGSVENSGKHVLDDRGLVKWWCRVLNPLLEQGLSSPHKDQWGNINGYLIVPGLDHYETRAFLPRTPSTSTNWSLGHPLEEISHFTQEYDWVPPRSLIPRYPDDPKSRFRDELDQEASKWNQEMGSWKSIKTVEQFWEMMAFRQECSSGRLTGFIWVVFNPKSSLQPTPPDSQLSAPSLPTPNTSFDGSVSAAPPSTPPRRIAGPSRTTPQSSPLKLVETPKSLKGSPLKSKAKKKKKVLKGAIIPRQPHVKKHQRNYLLDRPETSAYYYWPREGRGEKIVDESDYKRCVELLLHLDFATLEKAIASTTRWISEVGMGTRWGLEVTGTRELQAQQSTGVSSTVNNLSSLVKRKRPVEAESNGASKGEVEEPANKVNMLAGGLIRKKRKVDGEETVTTSSKSVDQAADSSATTNGIPQVNVLGAGLVRRKPKAA